MIFSVFETLDAAAPEWDRVLPPDHQLQSKYLKALQASTKDIDFRYVIFREENDADAIAVGYFQLIHFTDKNYNYPYFRNLLLKSIEKRFMKKGFGILACGNLFRIDFPGIYIKNEKVAVKEIISYVELFLRDHRVKYDAILIKDWPYAAEQQWSKIYGYQRWPDDLTMKLRLNSAWKSFGDYIGALKHKYAQRVRRARIKANKLIRRELSDADISQYKKEIYELYKQVMERQVIRMGIINEDYFNQMKRAFNDQFKVFGYFIGERLVAFSSNIIYPRMWELHYIGFDYRMNETSWLYYNLMFDAIGDAIHYGKEELELGRTAREAKATLGAQPAYFTSFVRLNGAIARWIAKILATRFNQRIGTQWLERHPYKQDGAV